MGEKGERKIVRMSDVRGEVRGRGGRGQEEGIGGEGK